MAVAGNAVGDYLNRNASAPAGAGTWAFWFNLDADLNAVGTILIASNSGGTAYYGVGVPTNGTTCRIITSSTNTNGSAMTVGTWVHIAITRNGTTKTLYQDGVQTAQNTGTADPVVSRVFILSDTVGNVSGRVANLFVFDTDLSVTAIQDLMWSTRPNQFGNLWAWYRLLDVADITDLSGNARDLTANGTLATADGPPVGWDIEPVTGIWIPAGGTVFTVNLTAGITPAGALFTQSNKRLAAGLTPAGEARTQANKLLTAEVIPAGALFTQSNKRLAAGLTPAGAATFIKTKVVNLTAGLTPAGALLTQANKLLTAGLTPAATLLTQTNKALAAALTPTTEVRTQTNKRLAAGLTPTGAATFIKTKVIALTAGLTPTAALLTQTNKRLTAALTPATAVLTQTNKLLAAGLTPAGALLTQTNKLLTAALTPAAALLTQTNKRLAAALTPTATASFARIVAGAVLNAAWVIADRARHVWTVIDQARHTWTASDRARHPWESDDREP